MYTHYSSTPQPQPQQPTEEDDGPWVWCHYLRLDELNRWPRDLTLAQIREFTYLVQFVGRRCAEPPIIDDDPHDGSPPPPPIYYDRCSHAR